MNFLKHIFASYTEYIRALLIPLGPWGIFLIAFVDAAFLGIPMDPLVAYFVYRRPGLFWLYALMGAAGSALGSLVVYYIGRKGEEVLLEKRIPKQTLQRIRGAFERHEFLALMLPAMLPPPTPFKFFVLTAGGPGGTTMLPSLFAYNEAFRYGNFGYAAAMGNVMVILIGAFLFLYLRGQMRRRLQ